MATEKKKVKKVARKRKVKKEKRKEELSLMDWVVIVAVLVVFAIFIAGGVWAFVTGIPVLTPIIGVVATGLSLIIGGAALIVIGLTLFYYLVYKRLKGES
jgi:uncharacterized membrane protein